MHAVALQEEVEPEPEADALDCNSSRTSSILLMDAEKARM
jgi:hypothetical protein